MPSSRWIHPWLKSIIGAPAVSNILQPGFWRFWFIPTAREYFPAGRSSAPATPMGPRFVCANTHPDHDTICTFRHNNGALLHRAFTQILEIAAHCGVLKVRQLTAAIDGTKVLANARKQAAVSYGHDGIPAIFTTWACKSEFGMESGLRSLQLQTPAYCWSQSPPGMMETQTIPFDEDEAPMTECRPCKNQKAQIFKNGKS